MFYEPRYDFDIDLAYGHEGEANLKAVFGAAAGGKAEVKSDRYRNGRMVVETHQKPNGKDWQPSGINVTTAEWWAYRFAPDSFILISVARLKRYLRANLATLTRKEFASDGNNPARGFLLYPDDIQDMMNNRAYDE